MCVRIKGCTDVPDEPKNRPSGPVQTQFYQCDVSFAQNSNAVHVRTGIEHSTPLVDTCFKLGFNPDSSRQLAWMTGGMLQRELLHADSNKTD